MSTTARNNIYSFAAKIYLEGNEMRESLARVTLLADPVLRLQQMQRYVGGPLDFKSVRIVHHTHGQPVTLALWCNENADYFPKQFLARHTPWGVIRGSYLITRIEKEEVASLTSDDFFALAIKMETYGVMHETKQQET